MASSSTSESLGRRVSYGPGTALASGGSAKVERKDTTSRFSVYTRSTLDTLDEALTVWMDALTVTPPPSPSPTTATRDSTDGDDPSVPLYNRFKSASTPSTPPPLSPRPYFPGGRRGRGDGAFSEEWTPGNSRNNSSSGNGTPRGTTVLQPELSGYHVDQAPSGDGVQGGSGTCLGGRQSDESEWEVVDSPGLQASFVALPAKLKKNRRSSAPLPVAPTKPPPKRLFRRGAIGTGWSLLRRSPGGRVSPTTVTGDRRVWSD